MARKFTNFAFSALTADLAIGGTTAQIKSEDAARFPVVAAGDDFMMTLWDRVQDPEIVRCTARSAEILTIQRAQEGTAAAKWLSGTVARVAITAGMMAAGVSFQAANANLDWLAANLSAFSKTMLNRNTLLSWQQGLALEPGVDVQPWDSSLQYVADNATSYGLELIAQPSYLAMRTVMDVQEATPNLQFVSDNLTNTGKVLLSTVPNILNDQIVYATGSPSPTGAVTALTAKGREIIGATDSTAARTAIDAARKVQKDVLAGVIMTAVDGNITLAQNMPYAGTITSVTTICSVGSCTLTTRINGAAIGAGNAVSGSEQIKTYSAAFAAGDDISIAISGNAGAEKVSFTIVSDITLT